jgi:hypothetical protein
MTPEARQRHTLHLAASEIIKRNKYNAGTITEPVASDELKNQLPKDESYDLAVDAETLMAVDNNATLKKLGLPTKKVVWEAPKKTAREDRWEALKGELAELRKLHAKQTDKAMKAMLGQEIHRRNVEIAEIRIALKMNPVDPTKCFIQAAKKLLNKKQFAGIMAEATKMVRENQKK